MKIQSKKENIRQRAFLNSVTSWIDIIAKLIVRFFIDPFIISFLGTSFYGVWQILIQLNNYLATADLRAATALKWIIAKERTTKSEVELRESVSASFFTNVLFLPLFIIAGVIIIYISPYVTNVESEHYSIVRLTSAIMVIAFICNQFFFLFESVLVGMNLSYKRIGLRAIITILTGLLTYVVLKFGYSIDGLAIVNLFTVFITGISFAWIVQKAVPWFGFAKIKIKQVISFTKLSGWFMADKIITLLEESVDLILLGIFAGPEIVASYTVSKYVIVALHKLFNSGQSAITPGVTKFVSEGKIDKIIYYRKISIIITWFFLGLIGTVFIFWNKSFVSLWTNENLYMGNIETFLIALMLIIKSLQSIHNSIITMTLKLKKKILLTSVSAIITIVLCVILIPKFQIKGLLISLIIGQLIKIFLLSNLVKKFTGENNIIRSLLVTRLSFVTIITLMFAAFIVNKFNADDWISLILYILISTFIITILNWFIALNRNNKSIIIENIKLVKFKKIG